MEKQQLKDAVINCILYGGSVILFLVILFAAISAAHANIPEKGIVETHDAKIIRAYEKLLHEVWLDKPSYVEDALMEGDAFIELDELLDGEWGDVFVLKDKRDSIRYQSNWDGGEYRCIHEF